MPFTIMDRGNFTSDGNTRNINLPASADYFVLTNLTQAAAANTAGFSWQWWPQLNNAEALESGKAGSNAVLTDLITTGGFTYRTAVPEPEAAVTITTPFVDQADPTLVTATSHGYSTGDRIRLYGTTGMLQISTMEFTITRVDANSFSLDNLDSSGFAAASTAGFARRLPSVGEVQPEAFSLTAVTQAASAVVTTSVDHTYQVGQLLTFSVPSSAGSSNNFGMVELDGLTGKVTARTADTVTVDIDSQAFTAFAFPASSATTPLLASVAPAGQRNTYDVTNVPFKSGSFVPYMHLGAELVGAATGGQSYSTDSYVWQAWKSEV